MIPHNIDSICNSHKIEPSFHQRKVIPMPSTTSFVSRRRHCGWCCTAVLLLATTLAVAASAPAAEDSRRLRRRTNAGATRFTSAHTTNEAKTNEMRIHERERKHQRGRPVPSGISRGMDLFRGTSDGGKDDHIIAHDDGARASDNSTSSKNVTALSWKAADLNHEEASHMESSDVLDAPSTSRRRLEILEFKGIDPSHKLGNCEGDCDKHSDCQDGYKCFQRDAKEYVPSCSGAVRHQRPGIDFCIKREFHPDFKTTVVVSSSGQGSGGAHHECNGIPSDLRLGMCQADCDCDADCLPGLICRERYRFEKLDACPGTENDGSPSDYCVPASITKSTTNLPIPVSRPPRIVSDSSKWEYRGHFNIPKPNDMKLGDVLFMFLNRSDDRLPIQRANWKTVGSCYKEDNAMTECIKHHQCIHQEGDYCITFNTRWGHRGGQDLATVVFAKNVTQDDIDNWNLRVEMPNRRKDSGGLHHHAGWANVVVIRDADKFDPVRDYEAISCDNQHHTVFPSVKDAKKNDLLILHMASDDRAEKSDFEAPVGTTWAAFVHGDDETSAVYQQTLTADGPTGKRRTRNYGMKGVCKDVSMAFVIRPEGS